MAEVRLLGERVEEGERKRGWRKRKEENGVQAPNRAEIILDHKGWNSIENLGYSKNCQSIVEKGKRPDEQDVGVEGQVQVLTAWPEKKRRVNDTLSLIFFLKNTSSPVNVMEKWKNSWQEGERKRGWRKKKEENGVQAPNRADIILDHKGWNSIENLGYSKNCQSIVEKGKRPEWTRRWSRGSGSKFSQLDLRRKE